MMLHAARWEVLSLGGADMRSSACLRFPKGSDLQLPQNLCPTIGVILHQFAACHVGRRPQKSMSAPPAGVVPSPEPRPDAVSTLPG